MVEISNNTESFLKNEQERVDRLEHKVMLEFIKTRAGFYDTATYPSVWADQHAIQILDAMDIRPKGNKK